MTLDEAVKALVEEFSIEDYIYDVRDRVGGSWDHPRVVRFSDVVMTLKEHIAKEAE